MYEKKKLYIVFIFYFIISGRALHEPYVYVSRWCENEHASKTPANDHSTTEGVARICAPLGVPAGTLFYPHWRRITHPRDVVIA